ncbi:MAG: GAF domain-containing protein [Bradymonadaceae bacterium]|nr:GAF domain-containing protein [Lujinxingiaceae bacterium]
MVEPLQVSASDDARSRHYALVLERIEALLADEDDWTAAMATVACELHHGFGYFHWTGFYRVVGHQTLVVGPYQGGHGCLRIAFSRGVCGKAASSRLTQRVDDVHAVADHIACSATTRSEIVVPVLSAAGELLAVLDVDSDLPAAFGALDQLHLEQLCARLGARYGMDPPAMAHPNLRAK